MRRALTFILTLLCATLTPTVAQTLSDEAARAELTAISKAGQGVETIVATYAMTRRAPLMADVVKDAGTFCYSAKMGGLALTSTQKRGERTVMTRDIFISESEGHTTRLSAAKNPVMSQMLSLVAGCLSGDFEALKAQGTLTYSHTPEGFVVSFAPTGKRVAKMLKEIRLTFSPTDHSLIRLHIAQKETEYTDYIFSGKKYNVEVKDDLFV